MRAGHLTAIRYVAFAILSAAANFLAQQGILTIYKGWSALGVSILGGTGIGFVVKYGLDKFYIFDDGDNRALAQEARKIGLYGLTAVLTTLLFWSMELGFLRIGETAAWKYVGGGLGLAMGYALKYFLDRRLVFRTAARS